jgi:hypothetical protein
MTKLTQEELELLHDLDAAPPKFSAREFDDRHRFGDPGTMQFLAAGRDRRAGGARRRLA